MKNYQKKIIFLTLFGLLLSINSIHSQSIKEIEIQVGAKLFDRKGTSIQLTQSGKILYEHAEKIRNVYRDMEFEISQINQQQN